MVAHFQNRSARLCALLVAPVLFLALGACQQAERNVPGDSNDHTPWQGIAAKDTVYFAGTEPFWSGDVAGMRFTYKTPDNPEGEVVQVSRFAGRGGLSFSGQLAAGAMTLAITPGTCTDGMSDRTYPFIATLEIGGDVRQGCAWTDRQPYAGGG